MKQILYKTGSLLFFLANFCFFPGHFSGCRSEPADHSIVIKVFPLGITSLAVQGALAQRLQHRTRPNMGGS